MEIEEGAYGVLIIFDGPGEARQIVLEDIDDAMVAISWEARRYELFTELTADQIIEQTRNVRNGMSRRELLAALEDVESGREVVNNFRRESRDHPGIPRIIAALDQLESAIASAGLRFTPTDPPDLWNSALHLAKQEQRGSREIGGGDGYPGPTGQIGPDGDWGIG